jgi:membrane-associated phospholipid phosphatase
VLLSFAGAQRVAAQDLISPVPTSEVDLGDEMMAASLTLSALEAFGAESPRAARFRGGLLFDEPMRDLLRFESPDARIAAGVVSDVILWSLVAAPVIDHVFALALGDRDLETVGRMLLVDLQAYALTTVIVNIAKASVGRARPDANACMDTDSPDECLSGMNDPNESFLSGHTAMAFTGAGLVCAHASSGQGEQGLGAVGCAATLALASITGFLRVIADRHYSTDVLAGAALGLISGYFIPSLLLD